MQPHMSLRDGTLSFSSTSSAYGGTSKGNRGVGDENDQCSRVCEDGELACKCDKMNTDPLSIIEKWDRHERRSLEALCEWAIKRNPKFKYVKTYKEFTTWVRNMDRDERIEFCNSLAKTNRLGHLFRNWK